MKKKRSLSILIIGSGGREHALGWKILQSSLVKKLYFAPGNAGTPRLGENIAIGSEEIEKLAAFAKGKSVDLTVVGPEAPLTLGIVDKFQKAGLQIFGPSKLASRLEADKAWAVEFMQRQQIPHPASQISTDPQKALAFIKKTSWKQIVVKAAGLAAGKGVIVCDHKKQAFKAVEKMMVRKEFGLSGEKIVLQERIFGEEVSILAFSDGKTIVPLLPAQDHKRVFDHDQGPNTGGMGAYAPVPFISAKLLKTIQKTILEPTIAGLSKEGYPYQGVLYAGLMITKNGPQVIEFNVRFGDPEAQPLMMLLKSDLVPIMFSCIEGNLQEKEIIFKKGSAICVVAASSGYPGPYEKGKVIQGLSRLKMPNLEVFQAGTTQKGHQTVSSGGRVFGITAWGKDLAQAAKKVYRAIKKIRFEGLHFRTDIGQKALKNDSSN